MITHELRTKVEERLFGLLGKVRSRWPDFAAPRLEYYDNKRAAGQANYRNHTIALNAVLLTENESSMLHETVAHELAHLVVWHAYRTNIVLAWTKRPSPHGREWQTIMRRVFGVEPERTHTYDCTNVRSRVLRTYKYTCGCRVHAITAVRHTRIMRGAGYRCKVCKQPLIIATGG